VYSKRINNTYWIYPAYLGTNFISEYYILSHALNHTKNTLLEVPLLRSMLLQSQLSDGSWKNVPEKNKVSGELDTTIFNYWALKVMGESLDSYTMRTARSYILMNGGLDQAQTMTKFWLSMFGNYEWSRVGFIPLFVFNKQGIFSMFFVQNLIAQWVYPHLVPMAYSRSTHITYNLGPNFSLHELIPDSQTKRLKPDFSLFGPTRSELETLIERMLEIQQPAGSFGAYTVSSLFSIVCMKDFMKRYPDNKFGDKLQIAIDKAFNYIEMMYFKTGEGSYMGVLDDGRYWDTALAALSLIESKEPSEKLFSTYEYFAKSQQPNGGIPYGLDFEYASDTDDTALATMFMCKLGQKDSPTVQKALKWLKEMQNSDGGYAAFDKNRQGNFILAFLTKVFANSAEPFDPSCADLAGHILEAFGTCGLTLENDKEGILKRVVDYMKKNQDSDGKWEARWGVNYIYSMGAVFPGLKRIGYNMKESWITKAVDWLLARQMHDGSFGESTQSYVDPNWAGRGFPTPSQTAWALLALIEVRDVYFVENAMKKAVEWLVNYYEIHGTWIDESSVGTGHRKILYMQYPAYSHTFPLIALSRYLTFGF